MSETIVFMCGHFLSSTKMMIYGVATQFFS